MSKWFDDADEELVVEHRHPWRLIEIVLPRTGYYYIECWNEEHEEWVMLCTYQHLGAAQRRFDELTKGCD